VSTEVTYLKKYLFAFTECDYRQRHVSVCLISPHRTTQYPIGRIFSEFYVGDLSIKPFKKIRVWQKNMTTVRGTKHIWTEEGRGNGELEETA